MERVEVELKDAGYKTYYTDVITEKELRKILEEIPWKEIVEAGEKCHCDDYGDTYVCIDAETGELDAYQLSSGSFLMKSAHLIDLWKISANQEQHDGWDNEYLSSYLTAEDYQEYEKLQKQIDEAEDNNDLDLMDELIEKQSELIRENYDVIFWQAWKDAQYEEDQRDWSVIEDQISELYTNIVEEGEN